MTMIPFLIGIPAILALMFPMIRQQKSRAILVYLGAGIIMLTTMTFLVWWIGNGAQTMMLYTSTEVWDHLMIIGDIFLMCLIVYLSIKYRRICI